MRFLICFTVFIQITLTYSSTIEVSNHTSGLDNSTLTGDSIVGSKASVSTSASLVIPAIEKGSAKRNVNLISPEKKESAKETKPDPISSRTISPARPNNSSTKPNSTSHEAPKENEDKNGALSSEVAEPVILIPSIQNSAQSVIIPTLRAYQKYFTPSNPINMEKRKANTFTDTATKCPVCGRMICGNNGNLCPVCLHSGRSDLAVIEKSLEDKDMEDPFILDGMALRKRRKNAWRVATLMRPGSLAANLNQLPKDLREGRNLFSWFGLSSSQNPSSQSPGQTLDYRPTGNLPPAFDLPPNDQIIQRPSSSQSSQSTFLHEASIRPQFAKCLYPEIPVLKAPQAQISPRMSSFQTMLSELH